MLACIKALTKSIRGTRIKETNCSDKHQLSSEIALKDPDNVTHGGIGGKWKSVRTS